MRKILLLAAVLSSLSSVAAALDREPWEVYADRRSRLRDRLSDGVTVLFGYSAAEGENLRTSFRQESNLYYLTGWNQPGAILLLIPPIKERTLPLQRKINDMPREILFLPARSPREERWTGPKTGPYDENLLGKTGFHVVMGTESFERQLGQAAAGFGRIYTLKPRDSAPDRERTPSRYQTLEKIAPSAEIDDARAAITDLRMVKSAGEIDFIQRATDASIAAHLAAWKRAKPGLYEYQIAATMVGIMLDRGCQWPAYSPIIGAGLHSTILHYSENSGRLDSGQLLVMDVGGEYSHYATDITRTIPVDGRFTQRQKELYEIVLGAQNAALAAVKPGMSIRRSGANSLHQIAYQYINTHGKDREGNPLGKYFIHGLSHHVGLEVHDPSNVETPLAPGMVITMEPGIYIPDENLGVRIEDMILVVETGAKLLTSALPRDPDAVEQAMR